MSQVTTPERRSKLSNTLFAKPVNRETFLEKAAQAEWPSRRGAVDFDGSDVSMLAY